MTIFVENDKSAIRKQERRAGKTAIAPHNLARLNIDGREWRRPKVAARAVDRITDANRIGKVDSHQAVRPHFLDLSNIARAREFQDTTTAVVSTRNEQQIVSAPNRR